MAFELKLGEPSRSRGWKVKVRDRERVEPPHVSILHKRKTWRFDLRAEGFMDDEPDPADVPEEVVAEIKENLQIIRDEWDKLYPYNPISSIEDGDGEENCER